MHSFAWMNGQCQQVGQSSQAATHDKMRNQKAGSANNYSQYMTANSRVRPPQSAHSIFLDGDKRQMTNCQTSAASHHTLSFQQPAGWKDDHFILKRLLQNSSTNTQTGNPFVPVNNGFQGSTQHNISHHSAPNSFPQSPPGMMVANTTYPHQDMPQYWDQPVPSNQSTWTKDGNIISDLHHYRVQKPLHQNVNGELMKPISAYATKATSLVCKQDTNTMSATAPNGQAVHNQIYRQNGTQHGLCSPPPCYSTAVSQSLRNNKYTAKSLSNGQLLHASSMNQKTQQYAPQLNTTQSIGQDATCAVNSNSYGSQYEINKFFSKINQRLFNATAITQQKMPKVARIVDTLPMSDTAGSDAHPLLYTSSSYRGKQVVNEVRMTESNQTLQPVTATESQIYNSVSSGQYLSNTNQNVMSSTQHFANVPLQQNSAADSLNVTKTSDGSRSKADSPLSKRSLVGFSNNVPQLMQVLENISPQKDKTQLSTAKSNEILEKLSPGKQSESYIHSSPGHTGTKAVAIVQPLSQESYQVASKCSSFNAINELGECSTAEKSLSNPDKACISPVANKQKSVHSREGFNLYTENPNQMRPNEFAMKHLATPNDDIVVSSSRPPGPQDLWPKQLSADDTRSEPAINMLVDQQVETAAQQSVTIEVPGDQKSKMDQREIPTGLPSLPTIPWTTVMLTNLINDEEKAQKESEDFTEVDSARKILTMFWNSSCRMLAEKLKTGWYKNLITDVIEFCDEQVTADSVVLLQVKHSFGKLLKSYNVLKDNEVYSEPTYKSSWLNVNEQLDNIDKEFGFPWSLKHRLIVLESDSEPNQDRKITSIPAHIESEVPNKVLSQIEPVEPVSGEDKQAPTVEPTITQASSPCKTDCADSSDPFYDIEIQVLPPEEAKKIFEQLQSNMAHAKDMDNWSKEAVNSPTEGELHEVKDVTFKKSELEIISVSPVKQVCCISRWLEIIVGPNGPPLSKCQCKEEQSHKDSTEKILVKEETIEEKTLSRFDLKLHSAVKGENQGDCNTQASGREKNHMITFSCPEFSDEHSQGIDLNEDRQPHLYFDKETKDISHISINDSQSSNIMISENEAKENSGSENEFPKQIPALGVTMKDPEEECAQDQLKSAQNNELCAQPQRTSTDMTASSVESRKEKCKAVARKRKTLSSKDGILPFVKIMKKCKPAVDRDSQPVFQDVKCKKDFGDAPETKPLATNGRTVELMLFGSTSQDKCIIASSPKSKAALLPPEVLTMRLSPLRRMGHDSTGAHSGKQRIREKWRSLPPTQIRKMAKMKTQKCTFASIPQASFKKAETASTNTMEPEMKMRNKNSKRSLSLKRRSSHSNGGKIREKMKKNAMTLKQYVDQVRSESDNGCHAGIPLKENNVLRFNILPNTFNFKSGSSEMKEITDPVSDVPDHAEKKHKCPNKTTMREGGTTWYPNPEKKFCPLPSPNVAKTPGLFQEFQKKYMQKTQKKK